jgi:hypothetical protein
MISDWQASIAKADAADWITVAAYLIAAVVSYQASKQASLRREPKDNIFWRVTTGLLMFLAVNELLDMQTLLTAIGRQHAIQHGWYGEHRKVQYVFIVGLSVTAAIAGIVMLWLTRHTHIAVRVALSGLALIGLFILFRAASFHHFDEFIGRGNPAFNWGSIQEMLGILIVAGSAAIYASAYGTKNQ